MGRLSQIFTLAFAASTMLSMGLGLTVAEIVAPLRNIRFVGAALGLNFLIVPAAAWLLAQGLGLPPDQQIGLILISCVAGAPMVPKLVTIAKGDAASAIALVTLLIVVTVVFAPIALPLLLPGVTVDAGGIAISLAGQMLLPLAIGLFVRVRYPDEAADYRDEVAAISNISLVLLLLVSVGQNLPALLDIGIAGLLAVLGLIAVAVISGYLLGVPAGVERRLLSLGAGQRNIAAAFIVATGNFADRPGVTIYIAAASLVMLIILFPLAGEWSKRPSRLEQEGRKSGEEPEDERLAPA